MGEVKRLAQRIAELIYISKLKDEDVLRIIDDGSDPETTKWYKEQIEAVRNNPDIYQRMAYGG